MDKEDEFYDAEEEDDLFESPACSDAESEIQLESTLDDNPQQETEKDIISKWGSRNKLPVPMFNRNDFTIWSILKHCIGKELSKVAMPVIFNEPTTFIQRMAEYLEYASVLQQASAATDPTTRLLYVTGFAMSACASNWNRSGKPFNPLLGETYELDRPDLGFRMVCEQVSHHPPVSAFHAEGEDYVFYGSIQPKLKFWGKSVECHPKGRVVLHLHKHGETYSWQYVNINVHNIIVGKIWAEHVGDLEVVGHTTGQRAHITFKPSGWFGRDLFNYTGHVTDSSGEQLYLLEGKWIDGLYATPIAESSHASTKTTSAESECYWKAEPRPANSSQYFHFTSFAMMLNDPVVLEPSMPPVPITDSRHRPDVRLLENGEVDKASAEKHRLEEKQRETRKARKKSGEKWEPCWFQVREHDYPEIDGEDWQLSADYWKRDWSNVPDIF